MPGQGGQVGDKARESSRKEGLVHNILRCREVKQDEAERCPVGLEGQGT